MAARGHPRASWLIPVCLVLLVGCGGGNATPTHTPPPAASVTTQPPAKPVARHRHPHPQRVSRPPLGSLPQTPQRPSAATAVFHQEMRALWRGVTDDSLTAALPAFFPERAYAQVKAIADAAGDWRVRLVGGYRLDLAAAHALLGQSAHQAQLVGVDVPAAFAHWVTPGTCYNRTGYWEVPNSRVVYRDQGALRSFGIASMISWRGIWYVVHLGAVIPSGSGGTVDSPSAGRGTSAYSGTC